MKKTMILILSAFLAFSAAACSSIASTSGASGEASVETDEILLESGDIILADGSVVKAEDLTSIDSGNVPVAVIAGFQEDGTAFGAGVHRSNEPLQWASDDSAGYDANFADTVCIQQSDFGFSGDRDGSDSWEVICSLDHEDTADAEENYPAFYFVNTYAETYDLTGDYTSGWYMPSIAELCVIYQNREIIDKSLQHIHGLDERAAMDGLKSNWYWSSSQSGSEDDYAWFVHYFNGYAGECPKNFTNVHVLAVRKF